MSSKAFSSTTDLFLSLTKTILLFSCMTLLVAGDRGGDGRPTSNSAPPAVQPFPPPPPQTRHGYCNCTLNHAKLAACVLLVGGEIFGPQAQSCCDGVEGLIDEVNRCFSQNEFSDNSNNNNGGANDPHPLGTDTIDRAHDKILSLCGIPPKVNIN